METIITATDLARNLSDILSRVEHGGDYFMVERDGEIVATLGPTSRKYSATGREISRRIGHLRVPEGMGDDIESMRASLRT
jgi:antitoxin (DNA-binding transcriptional repressor) of toxin-antitoxin stability system